MDRDVTRQAGVVVGALALVILGGTSEFGSAQDTASRVIPAGWAFAIWLPIFLGALVFAAYQARPAVRTDPLLRRVGWPIAAGYLGAGLWGRVFDLDVYVLAQALVVLTMAAAAVALARLGPATPETRPAETWLVRAPIALFTGWLTLATVAGTTDLLLAEGVDELGLGAVTWAVVLLLVAGAIATAVTLAVRASFAYPLALTWGFVGVAAQHTGEEPVVGVTASVMAVLVAAAGLWTGMQAWRPARGAVGGVARGARG